MPKKVYDDMGNELTGYVLNLEENDSKREQELKLQRLEISQLRAEVKRLKAELKKKEKEG